MDEEKYMLKGGVVKGFTAGDSDLAQINELALEPLSKEQVYTFEVVACDNDIDRDYERFGDDALAQLAKLFVGKTIIKDHARRADNQFARVYAAEVQEAAGTCTDGIRLKQLVVRCYTLNNEANAQIISEIKAGIKKEVSVSFMPSVVECSICGTDRRKGWCEHYWGKEYDGQQCHFIFKSISDAYELSFVAVPAQKNAGTRKDYTFGEKPDGVLMPPETKESKEPEGDPPDDIEPEEEPEGEKSQEECDDQVRKEASEDAFFMSKTIAIAEAYMATKED